MTLKLITIEDKQIQTSFRKEVIHMILGILVAAAIGYCVWYLGQMMNN